MDPTPDSELTQDDTSNFAYQRQDSAWISSFSNAELKKMKLDGIQAADRVRALYTSGVPFFTKHAIADLVAQLNQARNNFQLESTCEGDSEGDSHSSLIFLQGLDGKKVGVENELGIAFPRGRSTEQVMVNFAIIYRTYEHLIKANKDPRYFNAKLAYCPLQFGHKTRSRHMDTKVFKSPPKVMPFETTQVAFYAGVKAWEDSEECKKLRDSLMASTIPGKITKIIAFACYTISSGNQMSEDSITQHALILTIKDILQKKNQIITGETKLYAQDPIYKDVDKTVLDAAGICVLNDPYGFLEVDDSSVIISFSPNVPVRQIVADIARPAIMIWDKVKSEEEMIQSWSKETTYENAEELAGSICDPESSRLRAMVENQYTEIHRLSGPIFGDSCVYVRRC